MKKHLALCILIFITLASANAQSTSNKINLRLKWAYQAQFAGYLVAQQKGFYKDAGLDVNIEPGGPDLTPYRNVASGIDDIGIGTISQILTSRSNNLPLVAIAQIFQDSPNRFVLKGKNRISSLADLKGKKVGLWMDGDEVEFISMLKTVGLTLKDVQVVPQKMSIDPFLHDDYVCSQVMVYNELNQIYDSGYKPDQLQIISPKDYHADILGDLIFTNQKFLSTHQSQLEEFLSASFRGWKYAKDHPDETADIILKYNHTLRRDLQLQQLNAILSLIFLDETLSKGLGYINPSDYSNAKQIMLRGLNPTSAEYKKLSGTNVNSTYTMALWDKVSVVK